MGNITKFILKHGATGSTARWVAKHYIRLKEPNLSNKEVMNKIVDFRYKTFNANDAKKPLVERLSNLDNLTDFTFSILQLEGAINTKEMPMELQMEAIQVIREELEKKSVPQSASVGNPI